MMRTGHRGAKFSVQEITTFTALERGNTRQDETRQGRFSLADESLVLSATP